MVLWRDYRIWNLQRSLEEANQSMVRFQIQPLEFRLGNLTHETVRSTINRAFKKEVGIQWQFGSEITNPAGVILNKIRHEILNYDAVQDDIARNLNAGHLDCCTALKIRLELLQQVQQLSQQIINLLPEVVRPQGNLMIPRRDLEQQNYRDYLRHRSRLEREGRSPNCGNCGSERSSTRTHASSLVH